MAKKENIYFSEFSKMIAYSSEAADFLSLTLKNFDAAILPEKIREMHAIEHSADMVRHGMMKRLVKEFITPIEREDIINIADEADDITDKIEDVLIRMYMYGIKDIREEALKFAEIIVRSCRALEAAMAEFPMFQKSKILAEKVIEVNTLEEEGDVIYISAMRRLFSEGGDPLYIASWRELFDLFEECCDICEHTANCMEIVVLKNS